MQGHNAPALNQDRVGQCVLVEFGFGGGAFDGLGCEVRVLEFGNAGARELEFPVSLGPSRVGNLPGRVVVQGEWQVGKRGCRRRTGHI